MQSINSAAENVAETAAGQLGKFFDDLEDLLRRVTHFEDADISRLRRQVESKIETVRDSTVNSARRVTDTTVEAARTTDKYVHERPWTAIGITAVACLAVGALISRR